MGLFSRFTQKYLYSDELPLHARVVNLTLLVGMFSASSLLVVRLIWPFSIHIVLITLAALVGVVGLFVLANAVKRYIFIGYITVVFISLLLFPLLSFILGGVDSTIAAYYVLGVTVIFLMLRGPVLIAVLVLQIVLSSGALLLDYYGIIPVSPIDSSLRAVDQIATFIVIGICTGSILLFKDRLYLAENLKTVEANNSLIQAREAAETASRAKGDFLSNMSHEMRTPMNAIIGMTSIGLGANNLERKDYAFSRIENASKHLLGVINDILDMSKIEAGKLELSPVDFSLQKLLERVVDVMSFRVNESELVLTVHQQAAIPPLLFGDDQRLSQVITNLLANAIKFSKPGSELTLDCRLLVQTFDEAEIQISVADQGIGISEEQMGRLFHSFEQAESGITRKFGGTGLGLAIAKSIVEMMDGRIWVESELGVGSTFYFTVRLGLTRGSEGFGDDLFFAPQVGLPEAASLTGSLPGAEAPAGQKNSQDLSDYRVLLAEDVDINQEIIITLLEPTGIQIEPVFNGSEALARFSSNPRYYNLIFMDIQMPVMDGIEATHRIRALPDEWAQEVPIIAMTANVFKDDIERCLEAGMNSHVGKPIHIEDVIKKLNLYLKGKG